ncbi:CBS domain-containing protein [Vibrio coralliirubri]|uniref:CBS domain-containing protein n=1 Tax=Vibrio coralliirubri TaxID=1516159 RepID=UPI0012FF9A21|nr:CBS domain-containing protein [Vibrio coralliirubri]
MGYQLWMSPITGYRRNGTRFSALKKIFIDSVTVRDIYEPLLCCRVDDPSGHVKETLMHRQFDTAGVIDQNQKVIGYVNTSDLKDGSINQYRIDIKLEQVISDSTPLASLLNVLQTSDFLYVNHGAKIVGIITKADLNKPPVRIYVFGMLSLFEMHLNSWIRYEYPDNSWQEHISEQRVAKAQETYELRKQNNQDLSLLDCLQLADKRDLLAKSKEFRERFGFNKKGVERFIRYAERIRNEIAHSQDSIIASLPWGSFVSVLEDVDRFLTESDKLIETEAKAGAADFVEYLTTTA